jgi:DNA-binding CsgD family transcriptional regulator
MFEKILFDDEGRVRSSLDTLSRREREVVRMIVDGYTPEKIEDALDLERRTLNNVRARVFRKLAESLERAGDLLARRQRDDPQNVSAPTGTSTSRPMISDKSGFIGHC